MASERPTIGDLAFANQSGQVDPSQPWAVGIVRGWIDTQAGRMWIMGSVKGEEWGYYGPHCQKVTKSSARRLIRALRRKKPLFDQIWQCLIELHRHENQAAHRTHKQASSHPRRIAPG